MSIAPTLFIPILMAMAYLFSGTYQISTVIDPDGSAQVSIEIIMPKDNLDDADEAGLRDLFLTEDPEEICNQFNEDLDSSYFPRGTNVAYEVGENEITCAIIISLDDLDELSEFYSGSGDVNRISMGSDDELEYDIEVDMSLAEEGERYFDDQWDGDIEYLWVLTVPYQVGDNNADEVSGSTLTWELEPGDTVSIEAISEPGISIWIWVAIIGAVCFLGFLAIGGVGAAIYFVQKKKD